LADATIFETNYTGLILSSNIVLLLLYL